MKIIIVCEKCEQTNAGQPNKNDPQHNVDRRFRSHFRQFPHGQDLLEVETDCPLVPGTRYELLLKGLYCESEPPRVGVGGMISFTCREHLTAVDLETEHGMSWAKK